MRRLIFGLVVGLGLWVSGCEVSDEIVGHALECGRETADSALGDLIGSAGSKDSLETLATSDVAAP